MLSGRYRPERLCRYWSLNKTGACQLCVNCDGSVVQEDICHILLSCPALNEARHHVLSIWTNILSNKPVAGAIVTDVWEGTAEDVCQFLLDCSPVPSVIRATQDHGFDIQKDLFYLTRLWTYSLHRLRQQLLGLR